MKLLSTLRGLMLPAGLLLLQRGVAMEEERAESRRAELDQLEATIAARRAQLADVDNHRPDCVSLLGYDCDTPNGCREYAEEWAGALTARRAQLVDEPPAEEEPAPGPQREDFPPEPSAARAGVGNLPVLAIFAGIAAAAAFEIGRRHRRAAERVAYLPTAEERRQARASLRRDEPAPAPWLRTWQQAQTDDKPAPLVDLDAVARYLGEREIRPDPAQSPFDLIKNVTLIDPAGAVIPHAGFLASLAHLIPTTEPAGDEDQGADVDELEPAGDEDQDADDVDQLEPAGDIERDPAYACAWGCGWAPNAAAHDDDKRLRKALHGNTCPSRPASMAV